MLWFDLFFMMNPLAEIAPFRSSKIARDKILEVSSVWLCLAGVFFGFIHVLQAASNAILVKKKAFFTALINNVYCFHTQGAPEG